MMEMMGCSVEERQDLFDLSDEYIQLEDDKAKRHSLFYILGTSLAFEAIMLSLAAWIFCRRDF